jgi:hypothetical protein
MIGLDLSVASSMFMAQFYPMLTNEEAIEILQNCPTTRHRVGLWIGRHPNYTRLIHDTRHFRNTIGDSPILELFEKSLDSMTPSELLFLIRWLLGC